MPFRVASETVSTAGIVISIIVMIVFTVLCTLLSLVMYRSNVLVYSDTGMIKTMKTSFSILKNERKKQTNIYRVELLSKLISISITNAF